MADDHSSRLDLERICRTARTSSTNIPGELSNQLDSHLVTSYQWPWCFMPICRLCDVLSYQNIARCLACVDTSLSPGAVGKLARTILTDDSPCVRLVAILIFINQADSIPHLIDAGLSDRDLPFLSERTLTTFPGLSVSERRNFQEHQFKFTAPILKLGRADPKHIDLHASTILPFENPPDGVVAQESQSGTYGEVMQRFVHGCHYEIFGTQHLAYDSTKKLVVAVKRLARNDEWAFDHEVRALKTMSSKKCKHLIWLLGTYKLGPIYHLIFPWANANLRQFWVDKFPQPDFTKSIVWVVEQIQGVAFGLRLCHNTHTGLENDPFANSMHIPRTRDDEKHHGRHGDIKPENLLWFASDEHAAVPNGDIVIGDFGLQRFHGRETRSKAEAKDSRGTATYEPPEIDLDLTISRKYDMWSMGCMLLEMVSWLLKGCAASKEFAEARLVPTIEQPRFFTDRFYEIVPSGNLESPAYTNNGILQRDDGRAAVVKPGVTEWVKALHRDPKASQFVHDFLDYIMKEILVPDPDLRCEAKDLCAKTFKYLEEYKRRPAYFLQPAPYPIVPTLRRGSSTRSATFPQ